MAKAKSKACNKEYVVLMVVVSWTSAVRLRAVRRSENSGAGGVLLFMEDIFCPPRLE